MNFFAYRIPGETDIHTGASDRLAKGLGTPGFVIAPFIINNAEQDIITIPADFTPTDFPTAVGTTKAASTSQEEHAEGVIFIIHSLNRIEEEREIRGKAVLARQMVIREHIEPRKAFHALCYKYPHAFVFLFHTEASGTWLGASPEPLLASKQGGLHTVALAGTRPAGTQGDWDEKNKEEQAMVAKYILENLRNAKFKPIAEKRCTFQAGPVEHLLTRIHAPLEVEIDTKKIINLLSTLSPTPALCGYPKQDAIEMLRHAEKFGREYYGGFCGPYADTSDFRFFVNLRSARLFGDSAILYAGGGITQRSNPESEWRETEAKLSTLLSVIK